jgi:simple sugar transport system ATP-binding protein
VSAVAEPILVVENATKTFGGVHALDSVSLTMMAGEVVALAGDNGAGKSTLIKIISGVHRPDSGSVSFCGRPVQFGNPREARDAGIETIYQDLALAENLDVPANIFLGREPVRRVLGVFPVIDRGTMRARSAVVLQSLDIHTSLDRPVRDLSGGQRQAVAIGRAIYWNARLLIMDEPTAALGVPEQRKVIELIHRLREKGVGVLFISHNLTDIFAVSDRIVVLRRGIKAGERPVAETDGDEVVRLMVGA